MTSLQDRLDALVRWATDNGARLHPDVEAYLDPFTGASLRVRPGAVLQSGSAVVTVPASLTLSFLNLGPANAGTMAFRRNNAAAFRPFPDTFVAATPPHVLSRFLLMHHQLLGRDSFWHPYIDALPRPDRPDQWMLPAFWPEDDLALLEGTNVGVSAREIRRRARREYKTAIALLERVTDDDDARAPFSFSRLLYFWAHCIFSARSFRPSLVLPDPVALRAGLQPRCDLDDFSILLPLFDLGNHEMTADVRWEDSMDRTGCAMVSFTPRRGGEQVFNNYGMKTNAELLLGYGFMIPQTARLCNDYVHVWRRRTRHGRHRDGDRVGEVEKQEQKQEEREKNKTREDQGEGKGKADEREGESGLDLPTGEGKPVEYLIAPYPMDDPRMLLGLLRNPVRRRLHRPVWFKLAHVDDMMVEHLVRSNLGEDGQLLEARFPVRNAEDTSSSSPFGNDAEQGLSSILMGQWKTASGERALQRAVDDIEFEVSKNLYTLKSTDIVGGEEEDWEVASLNPRQRLAVEYRQRCIGVLKRVLAVMAEKDSPDLDEAMTNRSEKMI